uniref:DNA topoisomerase I n=1 Tax=Geotrypetes seraphini TaxID=260995 RepID=A0A6P8Q2R3_GEOSA|nr:DNA topoisomerase I, mitochondrial isoform X3 [Geotrypetes seraphini]
MDEITEHRETAVSRKSKDKSLPKEQLYLGKEREASRLTGEVISENMVTRKEAILDHSCKVYHPEKNAVKHHREESSGRLGQRTKKMRMEDEETNLKVKIENQVVVSDTNKGGSTKDFQLSKETLNGGAKGEDKNVKIKKPVSSTLDCLMKHDVEECSRKPSAKKQIKEIINGELEKEELTDWKEREQVSEGESEKEMKVGKCKERMINGTSNETKDGLDCMKNNLKIEKQKEKESELQYPQKGFEAEKENESREKKKYDTEDEALLKTKNKSKSKSKGVKKQHKKTSKNTALAKKKRVSDDEKGKVKKQKKKTDERKTLKQNQINLGKKTECKDEGKDCPSTEKIEGEGNMNLVEESERKGKLNKKRLMEVEGEKKSDTIGDQLIETTEEANEEPIKRKELDLDHRREKQMLDKGISKEEKHKRKKRMIEKLENEKLEEKIKNNNKLTDKEEFEDKGMNEKREGGKIEVKSASMENSVEERLIIRKKGLDESENKYQILQKEQVANKENLERKEKVKDQDPEEGNTENIDREQVTDKSEKIARKEKIDKYNENDASEKREVLDLIKESDVNKGNIDERKKVNVQEELKNEKEGGDLGAEKIQVKVKDENVKKKEKTDVMTEEEKPEDKRDVRNGKLSERKKGKEKKISRRKRNKKIDKAEGMQEICEKRETEYENEKKAKEIWIGTNTKDLIKQIEVNSEMTGKIKKEERNGKERGLLDINGNEAEMINAEEKNKKVLEDEVEKEGSKLVLENGNTFEEMVNEMGKSADERGRKKNKRKLKEKEKKKPKEHKKRKINVEGDEVVDKTNKQQKNKKTKRLNKETIISDEDAEPEIVCNKRKQDKMNEKEKNRKRQMKDGKNKIEKEVQQNKKGSRKRKIKEEEDAESKPKKSKNKMTREEKKQLEEEKKQLEEEKKWKWWEEENYEDGVKWKFLEHKGPYFAPCYEPLPEDVKFYYAGEVMKLSEAAEEVATFYGKMLDHEYTTKEAFQKNFFHDWKEVMTPEEQKKIKHLHKCDFSVIHKYFVDKNEARKALPKEDKQILKQEIEKIQEEFGYCILDGHREKIGNFKTEPPGLFRGRGDHPKMGMLKKRIMPEDVIINCSKESKIPEPPAGHKWKEVRFDNMVTWLASWTENIQGSIKYIMLNPSSKLKGQKDWQKYEVARRLKDVVHKIRNQYRTDWKSREMKKRQRAVALYFVDKLALRAGNEKEEGETADTVGCCSLRVEHIKLHSKLDGKENVVEFDFLGKDSIRYYNKVPVEKDVFKNLRLFKENKDPGDELFDRLTTTSLNKHLQNLMDGLTAKVFRTYNASITLQEQLKELTSEDSNVAAKILSYNRANRAVALLCNHQRALSKTFETSMQNLQTKISGREEQLAEAKKELKKAKANLKANKDEKSKKLNFKYSGPMPVLRDQHQHDLRQHLDLAVSNPSQGSKRGMRREREIPVQVKKFKSSMKLEVKSPPP